MFGRVEDMVDGRAVLIHGWVSYYPLLPGCGWVRLWLRRTCTYHSRTCAGEVEGEGEGEGSVSVS